MLDVLAAYGVVKRICLPVIIKVFVDESGTHSASEYMMLAGYVGTLGKWNLLDDLWRKRLKRESLLYFHAVEHSRKRRYQSLCWDLLKMCGKHLLFGFNIRLDKKSYDDFYIANLRPQQTQLDTMYGVCYRHMVSLLINDLPTLMRRSDLQIDIVLEDGAAGSKDALRIHQQIKKTFPELAAMLGSVSFGCKKRLPGLQAADSLAHPALAEEKRPGLDLRSFPATGTLVEARRATSSTIIPPVFRVHLDATVLASLKQTILERSELQRRYAEALAAERVLGATA
jgi:hypothetical protein